MKAHPLVKFFWNNSLVIVLMLIFVSSFLGLIFTGLSEYNNEQEEHGHETISYQQYLMTGHFQEAVFENWESEFLQMWALVMLTIFLRQKGSHDSKKLVGKEEVDTRSRFSILKFHSNWRTERKVLWEWIYGNSLGLVLLALFLVSLIFHALSGVEVHNEELVDHGEQPETVMQYVLSSSFWFESFQNWQSEFLSVAVLIYLSIYLRQRGSPESKAVADPRSKTGQ